MTQVHLDTDGKVHIRTGSGHTLCGLLYDSRANPYLTEVDVTCLRCDVALQDINGRWQGESQ